jgi:hypothetical protein
MEAPKEAPLPQRLRVYRLHHGPQLGGGAVVSSFDVSAKRRKEIVQHARDVGVMDTDDPSRHLIAWARHNPKATDQIWSVMEAAKRMGGDITEAEAIAIADEAAEIPYGWKADQLAKYLGLTYQQRTRLKITTIGAVDFSKRRRTEQRRHNKLMAKRRSAVR